MRHANLAQNCGILFTTTALPVTGCMGAEAQVFFCLGRWFLFASAASPT